MSLDSTYHDALMHCILKNGHTIYFIGTTTDVWHFHKTQFKIDAIFNFANNKIEAVDTV